MCAPISELSTSPMDWNNSSDGMMVRLGISPALHCHHAWPPIENNGPAPLKNITVGRRLGDSLNFIYEVVLKISQILIVTRINVCDIPHNHHLNHLLSDNQTHPSLITFWEYHSAPYRHRLWPIRWRKDPPAIHLSILASPTQLPTRGSATDKRRP